MTQLSAQAISERVNPQADTSKWEAEIDHALARHYGLSDEELDFIVNYDVKYRMGASAGKDGEEDEQT